MPELANKECVPCKGGVPPLKGDDISRLLAQLNGWGAEREHHLVRSFTFPDFKTAQAFVNRVGDLAEQQGHHPDIYLAWGMVRVEIWTHTR